MDLEEDFEEAEDGDSQWRMFQKIEVPIGAVEDADCKPKLSKVQKPPASAATGVEVGNKISTETERTTSSRTA